MRIVIVDDAVLVRDGIASLLEAAGHQIAARAADAEGLLDLVEATEPDVIILDIRMPPTHTTEGLEAAVAVRGRWAARPVMVLSQHIETRFALDLIAGDAAGVGYLLKDRVVDVDAFVEALGRVAGGGTAIDPEVVSRLVARRRRDNPIDRLTGREREVLSLMAEGRSNSAIAETLVLNLRTVESHVGAIFAKLDLATEAETEVHRRVRAVLTYLTNAPT